MTPPAEGWLRVALILRPQGHKGEVIAELLTDFPERFETHPLVSLRAPAPGAPVRSVTVEQFRMHQGRIVFRFAECSSMNEAELLRGHEVVVPWEERMPLPEDEVYVAELDGCTLFDTRSGSPVGTIVDVDRESSNTMLLVVRRESGREVLVPFVKAYLPRWDLAARTVSMELPDGLVELEDPAGASE